MNIPKQLQAILFFICLMIYFSIIHLLLIIHHQDVRHRYVAYHKNATWNRLQTRIVTMAQNKDILDMNTREHIFSYQEDDFIKDVNILSHNNNAVVFSAHVISKNNESYETLNTSKNNMNIIYQQITLQNNIDLQPL